MIIPISDHVALRPSIGVELRSTEIDGTVAGQTVENSTNQWDTQFGGSILIYLQTQESLRPYIAARVTYLNSSTVTEETTPARETESTQHGLTMAGLFGGQYRATQRVAFSGSSVSGPRERTARTRTCSASPRSIPGAGRAERGRDHPQLLMDRGTSRSQRQPLAARGS